MLPAPLCPYASLTFGKGYITRADASPLTDLRTLRKMVHVAHAFQVLVAQLGQGQPFQVNLVPAYTDDVFRQAVRCPRIGRTQP